VFRVTVTSHSLPLVSTIIVKRRKRGFESFVLSAKRKYRGDHPGTDPPK
jgi:hypothetical protein